MAPCAIVLEQLVIIIEDILTTVCKVEKPYLVTQLSPVVVFTSSVKDGKFNPMILDMKRVFWIVCLVSRCPQWEKPC